MGRAFRSNDMEDSDELGMDVPEDDVLLNKVVVEDVAELTPRREREDDPETRSVTSRCRIREQLNHDIEAFLAKGGAIHHEEDRLQHIVPYNPAIDQSSRYHH
jgi:hypothetical protein